MISSELKNFGISLEEDQEEDNEDLNCLPVQSLFDIINNHRQEIAHLKHESQFKKDTEIRELKEQLDFVTETNKLLSSELHSTHNLLDEYKQNVENAFTEHKTGKQVEENLLQISLLKHPFIAFLNQPTLPIWRR